MYRNTIRWRTVESGESQSIKLSKSQTLKAFAKKIQKALPKIIMVTEGFLAQQEQDSVSSGTDGITCMDRSEN